GLNVSALNNYIKGYFNLSNKAGLAMEGAIDSKFHLDDIKKLYPVKGMDLRGDLAINVKTKGKYIPTHKVYPITKADINLSNGYIQNKYYPHPIENLQVSANLSDNTGSLNGLKVNIKPISLTFEGQPFMVRADLKNFNDLQYNIHSQGTLD